MNRRVGLLVMHGIGDQSPGSVAAPLASLYAEAGIKPYHVQDLCWSVENSDHTLLVAEANWSRISSPDNLPEIRLGIHILPRMLSGVAEGYRTCFGLAKNLPSRPVPWIWVLLIYSLLILFLVSMASKGDQLARIAVIFGALLSFPICFQLEGLLRLTKWWTMPFRVALALLLVPLVGVFLFTFAIWLPTTVVLSGLIFIPTIVVWPLVQSIKELSKIGAFGPIRIWVHRITWVVLVGPVQGFAQAAMSMCNIFSYSFTGPGSLVGKILTLYLGSTVFSLGILFVLIWLMAIASPLVFSQDIYAYAPDWLSSVIWLLPFGIALVLVKFALPLIDLLLDVSRYHLASPEERKRYTKYAWDGIMCLRSLDCTEIHILAHSLGTVIVYDWLRKTPAGEKKDVLSLTTIGSPLNKFWYMDHSYQERIQDIEGSVVAGLTWNNFYAWSDPVSSRLGKYGTGIIEERLRWLGVWGVAHVNYWSNDKVAQTIRRHLVKPRN